MEKITVIPIIIAILINTFKDVLSTLINGILIFIGDTFNLDDIIYINGTKCKIDKITLRFIHLKILDNNRTKIVSISRWKYLDIEITKNLT